MALDLNPPPEKGNDRFDGWLLLLWKKLSESLATWTGTGFIGTANTIAGFDSGGAPTLLARTGTGTVVAMKTSPALVTPDIGVATGTSLALAGGTALATTNQTGTGKLAMETSAQLVTPNIGVAAGTSLAATGLLKSSGTAGVGYAAGAGGAVTQATNKATGVTLDKICGQITMNAAALNAGVAVSFTVTNNTVVATDVPTVCIASGATAGAYRVTVDAVGAGSFRITVQNHSAGNLSEAVVINFAVIKAVNA